MEHSTSTLSTSALGASARRSVLIIQRSSNLDGSAFSGLLLANGLREAGWESHVVFGFDGPIIDDYESAGHYTYVVPHDNWLRRRRMHQFVKDVWLEWQKAKEFEALLDEVGPDLVYLNTVVSLAGAVAARRSGRPCVWHLREMFADVGGEMNAPTRTIPFVRRIIRWHADQIVANSVATARNLLGHNSDDVTIVLNAVRSAFFEEDRTREEARVVFDLASERTVIGIPGTLRPMKGHPFFLRSVAPLLRKRSELQVAITGEGGADFTAEIRTLVRELDIWDQVRFLGWVNDMPAFYRACDLICVPSRAEPFGRTVVESFAVGTPIVATAVGGISEIVDSGTTGLLVHYGDSEALARALRRLLDTPHLRQKISTRARQVAEKNYHERVYKQRVARLVRNTANSHQSAERAPS